MRSRKLKLFAIATTIALAAFFAVLGGPPAGATPIADDAATIYKAKCAMCHGQKAEKHFDPSIAEEELVKAILEGKKAEKPPNMPAYKDKGIDEAQAKALITHMKALKTPPSE
jgi:mono/diheme cytochrome c family protein